MKKLANLKRVLPKKSKLNAFQVRSLKGGADKRKDRIGSAAAADSAEATNNGD